MLATIDSGCVPLAAAGGRPEADSAAWAAALGRSALAVLNRLAHGVVLVDHLGRIRWRNAAAATILSRRDGLAARGNTLHATDAPAASSRLLRLIGGAGAGARRVAEVMAAPRASGRPLQVLVAPLPEDAEGGPSVVVFITDPDDRTAAPAGALARLFDLTRAESQLAAALAAGARTKEYAAARRLPVARVRTLLRHVQARCGACHRAELVRVLNDQAAAFGPTLRALDLSAVGAGPQPVA